MNTFRRKGNWNEIAGTLKHQVPDPTDKDLKKGKKKELSERLPQKLGKTKSEPRKPIAKT